MKYAVIIRPEAENDLAEAFSWYEEQRRGLGHDFLLQVDAGLRFLERNPESHPPEYQETRKHLIKKFPYKIIYLVKDGKIIVLAFFHAKRNPKTLKKRSV
ncbi:MAG TPA: type II toxin-antitoxin system RelE/ParE family toxin [Candidatus Manganitrophaceae bacterium]|nr:type II toxin-antitoxin system RelE/ParE family toxin [Candidatus Manganitrophaceae bacterium]